MTTIKASCPTCGDVELTAHQVRLVVCSVRSWSYYAFSCASCLEEVRKPAGRDVVALLISGGVVAELGDGRLRVTLRAAAADWVPRLALRLGGDLRVVTPPELADEVRRRSSAALAAYPEASPNV